MPTSSPKTLSPAELAKLEHAFATDPASDAYKSLAEAYLGMARYMEAMVVCKKGVKAHPTAADPHVLLARVYAEQGKDKKAMEELQAALQLAASDKAALRLLGTLQIKTGEVEPGKATLLKAWQADPNDAETQELLKQHQIAVQPAAPAPAPAPVAAAPATVAPQGPPVLHPVATQAPAPAAASQQPQQVATRKVTGEQPRTTTSSSVRAAGAPVQSAARARPAVSAARPAPKTSRARDDEDDDADDDVAPVRRASPKASKGASQQRFFAMLIAAPLLLGTYYGWGQYTAKRNREVKKTLEVASDELKHDSYASYKKACEAADKALEIHSDSVLAHGYLAYAWAIRWGEHGGGDDARKKAEDHLASAKSGNELSSHLYAAEALIQTYGGKGQEALTGLKERVQKFDAEGKRSSLLLLTLGLIQMNAGDLDGATDSLTKAQALAPDDPRVYAALGTLYRRRGQDNLAWRNFDFALRYEKDHPESLLGKALVLLEQDDAQYYIDAAGMIRKLVDADPPPSPRQLATAHLARAFLISRVSNEYSQYKADFQKKLLDGTKVPADKKRAEDEIAKEEDKGFGLDRTNPELFLIKGRRLVREGQIDPAVTEIRKAIAMDATRAQFHVELARALMQKAGGEKEAAASLVTAVKTMGNSPKLLIMLGQAYQRQGELDKAITQFTLALGDGKSKAPEARLALGTIYREKKDYAKSVEQLEKAAQEFVGQGGRVAHSYTELARALEEKGDRERAGERYQRAIEADSAYPDAYYFFARYLAQDRANASKAKLAAQEYLKLDPRGPFAQDAQRLTQ